MFESQKNDASYFVLQNKRDDAPHQTKILPNLPLFLQKNSPPKSFGSDRAVKAAERHGGGSGGSKGGPKPKTGRLNRRVWFPDTKAYTWIFHLSIWAEILHILKDPGISTIILGWRVDPISILFSSLLIGKFSR